MRNRAAIVGIALAVMSGRAEAQVRSDSTARSSATVARQDTLVTIAEARGTLFGFSIGAPGYRSSIATELVTLGAHWTQLTPGQPGFDVSVGTLPRFLVDGLVVLGARAGLAVPLVVGERFVLLPSAGVSGLGGIGSYGMGGTYGFNAGVAAVLQSDFDSEGLRVGITWHQFDGAPAGLYLLEVGWVRIPRNR